MSDPITAAELKKLRRDIEGHGCGMVQADTVLRLLDEIDKLRSTCEPWHAEGDGPRWGVVMSGGIGYTVPFPTRASAELAASAPALRDENARLLREIAERVVETATIDPRLRAENERMRKALDYGERLLKFVPQAHDIIHTMQKMRSGEYERELQAAAESIIASEGTSFTLAGVREAVETMEANAHAAREHDARLSRGLAIIREVMDYAMDGSEARGRRDAWLSNAVRTLLEGREIEPPKRGGQ